MKIRFQYVRWAVAVAMATAGCAQFKHVEPGHSVLQSEAKKPELVALPQPPAPAIPPGGAVEPGLPAGQPQPPTSGVDYFALGNMYMQEGKTTEATEAFKKATQADPNYAEAWHNLAMCYESAGDETEAMDAYKRYKTFPQR
ncbi:MAG: tetratricopeptide repeat protein [Chthoniobacteraceae bacterium]